MPVCVERALRALVLAEREQESEWRARIARSTIPRARSECRFAAFLLSLSALGAPGLAGQTTRTPEPPPAVDPYTRAEPARLARSGYLSLGPFRFGTTPSNLVAERLGDVPILWVETEHFRLGSSLEEYHPEQPEEIAALARELDALGETLDGCPSRPRKLDPWLRLHLFARRLERLHAEFRRRLGVRDGPPAVGEPSGAPVLAMPALGMPVLGMGEKQLVLITEKRSTLARFAREFCGQERDDALFHHFPETGALFFGLSTEAQGVTDADLHYALVHGVTQDLLLAIDGFKRVLPAWWQNGVALWFARASEPRCMLYVRPANETLPPDELADWEPLVRGRVQAGACLAWGEMLERPSWIDQPFGDNVVLWSRIDYLLRREGTACELVRALHVPEPAPASAAALQSATGQELTALDAAWRAWVAKNYRKKRR